MPGGWRPRSEHRRPAAAPPAAAVRWGTHAVEEALRAGIVSRVLLQDNLLDRERLRTLRDLASERDIGVDVLSEAQLTTQAGNDRHQGAAAVVRPFRYLSLEDLIRAPRREDLLFLVLDGIEDPQNLGAILRTADAAGAHGVVVAERRAAPVTPAVARASAGGVDHVAVAQVANVPRAIEQLKASGVWVYGLDAGGAVAFDAADYLRPVAIVAGAEGRGLSRLVRERCDVVISIPMHGHVASLNVSVATALALFAARSAREHARRFGEDLQEDHT